MKKSLVAGAFAFQIIGLVFAEEAKTPPPKADIKVESTVVHKKEPVKAKQASEVKKTEKVGEAPKSSAPKSEPVVVNKMKIEKVSTPEPQKTLAEKLAETEKHKAQARALPKAKVDLDVKTPTPSPSAAAAVEKEAYHAAKKSAETKTAEKSVSPPVDAAKPPPTPAEAKVETEKEDASETEQHMREADLLDEMTPEEKAEEEKF